MKSGPVAKATQLAMEYDPRPPFDSGALSKADPETIAWARWRTAQVAREPGLDPAAFADLAMAAAAG